MTTNHREIAWTQFGAAVDMLERAMAACPDELWSRPAPEMGFWYLAYHTLFLMDYDFSVAAEPFQSAKFDIHEYELREQAPPYENPYPRADLMTYLQHSRDRCRGMIGSLADDDRALRGCQRLEAGVFELVLYHIRTFSIMRRSSIFSYGRTSTRRRDGYGGQMSRCRTVWLR